MLGCARRRRCRSTSYGRRRYRTKVYIDPCFGFVDSPFAAGFGYVGPIAYPPGVAAGYPMPPQPVPQPCYPPNPNPYGASSPVPFQMPPPGYGYGPQPGQQYYSSQPSSPITVQGSAPMCQCYQVCPQQPQPQPQPQHQPQLQPQPQQQQYYMQAAPPCSIVIGPPPASCNMSIGSSQCSMPVRAQTPPSPLPIRETPRHRMRSSGPSLSSKYDLDRQFSYISQAPIYQHCRETSRPASPYYTARHVSRRHHTVTHHRTKPLVYPDNPFPNQHGVVC